ncbi:MAG: hypothetical protein HC779_02595, partial [Phyllobacteriaceae bacterium]|nr:hypothetical protein [Phyllobacteriaceae bacterium]
GRMFSTSPLTLAALGPINELAPLTMLGLGAVAGEQNPDGDEVLTDGGAARLRAVG